MSVTPARRICGRCVLDIAVKVTYEPDTHCLSTKVAENAATQPDFDLNTNAANSNGQAALANIHLKEVMADEHQDMTSKKDLQP